MPQVYFDFIRPLQKLYWYLFRPYRPGVKTFVFHNGNVLLVRIEYAHKRWVLPGGVIERGEDSIQTAIREVKEETGVKKKVAAHHGLRRYRRFKVISELLKGS